MLKYLAILITLLTLSLPSVYGQTATSAGSGHPQTKITNLDMPYVPATAAPAPWNFHEKIAWAANLVLAVLGYVGIYLGFNLMKKIERQTTYAEATAQAALEAANAASLNAQAILNSERPWILIRVEPNHRAENSFRIMATNRGRGPAQIVTSTERIGLASEEQHLPKEPEYAKEKTNSLPSQVILLPGESMVILPFGRGDLKWICKTEESLRRVERWQDTVFIYGNIVYKDLLAPYEKQTHETQWCCSYSHGENHSDLTIAGPPEYNRHS